MSENACAAVRVHARGLDLPEILARFQDVLNMGDRAVVDVLAISEALSLTTDQTATVKAWARGFALSRNASWEHCGPDLVFWKDDVRKESVL